MKLKLFIALLGVALLARVAPGGVKIADITRLGGQRTNTLVGIGLVYGLRGTGDGGDFMPAIRPLAAYLKQLRNTADISELGKASNVAVVSVTVTLPSHGVRNGDRVNVNIASLGAATSLKGGRLFVTPMYSSRPGDPVVYALCEGNVVVEDETVPTTGVVVQGCTMEADLEQPFISPDGKSFELILDEPSASFTMASDIAKLINGENGPTETIAVARDAKTIVVTIPESERATPDSFIGRVQQLPVNVRSTEARVVMNQKTGTIVITGDVDISPVVITHKGLTITTVTPPPAPTARNPQVTVRTTVGLATPEPTRAQSAKLADLIAALEQLKVPAGDRIVILKELHRSGKLHARLYIED